MFEFLTIILFVWISIGVIKLALRATWGLAKILATILFVLAFPVLGAVLLFAGGLFLLIPIGLVVIAFAILKAIL